MRVFKFWHREVRSAVDSTGRKYSLISYGASASAPEEAKQNALEKLDRWVSQLRSGRPFDEYSQYLRDSLREELLGETLDDEGHLIAAVTRNGYGALVLNTASLFIADVDVKEEASFWQTFLRIFGAGSSSGQARTTALARIRSVAAGRSQLTFLVYETCAGFRVFVAGEDFVPSSDRSDALLSALGSDTLYKTLCRAQNCYRARLTPKPWRCHCRMPAGTGRFPRQDARQQAAFDKWLAEYERVARGYATCRFVERLGPAPVDARLKTILEIHDAAVLVAPLRPLA